MSIPSSPSITVGKSLLLLLSPCPNLPWSALPKLKIMCFCSVVVVVVVVVVFGNIAIVVIDNIVDVVVNNIVVVVHAVGFGSIVVVVVELLRLLLLSLL